MSRYNDYDFDEPRENKYIENLKQFENEKITITKRNGEKVKGICLSIDYIKTRFIIRTAKDGIKLVTDIAEVSLGT